MKNNSSVDMLLSCGSEICKIFAIFLNFSIASSETSPFSSLMYMSEMLKSAFSNISQINFLLSASNLTTSLANCPRLSFLLSKGMNSLSK
ncbi:Uncharacterised protein [Segatella copri]|nr:Uncharacterised protein [Segatella copri]